MKGWSHLTEVGGRAPGWDGAFGVAYMESRDCGPEEEDVVIGDCGKEGDDIREMLVDVLQRDYALFVAVTIVVALVTIVDIAAAGCDRHDSRMRRVRLGMDIADDRRCFAESMLAKFVLALQMALCIPYVSPRSSVTLHRTSPIHPIHDQLGNCTRSSISVIGKVVTSFLRFTPYLDSQDKAKSNLDLGRPHTKSSLAFTFITSMTARNAS